MSNDDIQRMLLKAYGVGPWWLPKTETEWGMLKRFVEMIVVHERERLASQCERLPFGNTAHSFAAWIKQGGEQ